jgi:hypothetical protein
MKTTIELLIRFLVSLVWAAVGFFLPALILGPPATLLTCFASRDILHLGCLFLVLLLIVMCPCFTLSFFFSGLRGRMPGTRIVLA